MPIGEVLEKAFKYPWKNRALWFYGVLLAIFTAGSSASNQYQVNENDFKFLDNVNIANLWVIGALIVLLGLALMVIGIIITSWSTVAIARGTVSLEEGKGITRKEIGKTGKRPVWKLIVLTALIPILLAIASLLVIGALVTLFYFMPQPAGMWIGIAVGVIALLALIPFIVYWAYIWVLATRFVALENMNAFAALGAGRKLIKGRFWWTFLLGIVQGIVTGMASFVAMLPLIFLIGIAVFLVISKIWVAVVILGLLSLAYIAVYVVILGYFTAFTHTAWTLWWLELKKLGIEPAKISNKKATKAEKK